jgi:hypothetical protein
MVASKSFVSRRLRPSQPSIAPDPREEPLDNPAPLDRRNGLFREDSDMRRPILKIVTED